MSVIVVRVGPDPFGRGERTVFYRDSSVNEGKDVFYLWASQWHQSYPSIPIPADGYNIEPPLPPRRERRIPYVLEPGHMERLSNLITVEKRVRA